MNLERNNTVSIIVPIYNKEKYLERCLDSILEQTYSDLEIVLVDDGSSDRSLEICRGYAAKDGRIRVYSKANGGVSSARNLGMEKSTGSYLAFADPDDFMEPDCIRALKECVDEEEAEIAYCHPRDVNLDTGETRTVSNETGKRYRIKASEYRWNSRWTDTVSWGAVYRREVTEGIRFDPDLKIGEDTLFLGKCIHNANRLVQLDRTLYNYCINPESAKAGCYTPGKISELKAWERLCKVFEDRPIGYETANAGYALRCRELAVHYCKDEAFMKNDCAWIKQEFKKSAKYLLKDWLRQGRYDLYLKTWISLWFWDGWVRLKQTRKNYEIEF